jgi:DNA-binding response OmpR family regulator
MKKETAFPPLQVAIVDDDAVTCFLIGSALREHDINVFECESAERLFELLQQQKMDVIVLDLVLPKVNGLDALAYLREQSDVGVIMISSRANSQQRLHGLRDGADDFIDKPLVMEELVFKVQSLAMRVHRQRGSVTKQPHVTLGNCQIIVDDHVIVNTDEKNCCSLTDSEQRILISLAQHESQVCSRKLLVQCVHRSDISLGNDRSVDTLISRIRGKLVQVGCTASISAIRGRGYRLQIEQG